MIWLIVLARLARRGLRWATDRHRFDGLYADPSGGPGWDLERERPPYCLARKGPLNVCRERTGGGCGCAEADGPVDTVPEECPYPLCDCSPNARPICRGGTG